MTKTIIPRPEHPRPQMLRNQWMNLNGEWEFEIDYSKSGKERKLYEEDKLTQVINIPFCPESKLSGIENKDFMPAVWYRREFSIPEEWKDKHILLHFGAVDYEAEVWINGISAGKHKGGYSSFTFDITRLLRDGINILTVCAEDDVRSGLQPAGKQCSKYYNDGCSYIRTTGIWQTVWLECVSAEYIFSVKYIPDPENGCVHIEGSFQGKTQGYTLEVRVFFSSQMTGKNSCSINGNHARLTVQLSELHLWGPGEPNLYDLEIRLYNGEICVDMVESYFGLRSIALKDGAILINGKAIFQRLVLDQGFYPDGVYTAPTEEDLKRDIEIGLALGFNGARMHEKVFEQRYIYWADKLGYIVWGEHANWGLDITNPIGLERFLPEWMEIVERDFNSPAIVGWCPFNETWDIKGDSLISGIRQDDEVIRIVYNFTKSLDKTRPTIDTSGNFHVITDIFDVHDYEQDPAKFAEKFKFLTEGGEPFVGWHGRQRYKGEPYFVSEYGGIWWNPDYLGEQVFEYGERPKSVEEFINRYEGLTSALLNNPKICAFCYTQLYDVQQETNGLYTYHRKAKFNPDIFKNINTKKAAIEKSPE